MTDTKKRIGIVDGFSAGNLLAPEFKSRGFECVHVQSTPKIWDMLLPTFRPGDYIKNLALTGEFDSLANSLRALDLTAILPGTETGVELADRLSEALSLPTNGTQKSEARRNKFLMVEAAREHGLKVAVQMKSANVDEILDWSQGKKLSKVVIKPINSAGTDSVVICSCAQEIRAAAAAILGTVNKLGIANVEVLAQEFLQGTEYFINTVSLDCHHRFTDMWRYRKRTINARAFVYDCNELLPYDGLIQSQLRGYVLEVLAALEIKFGPAHTEVIMTTEGPALVESGARLDGLSVPAVNEATVGYGPLDLTADAYVAPTQFMDKTEIPYRLKQHALTVYLTSYAEGNVKSIPGESRIRSLPSFFQARLRVKEGSEIKCTTDYFTAPGFVTLVHPDPRVILADYEWIRSLETKNELFALR